MAAQITRLSDDGKSVCSPFTDQPAEIEDRPNEADPSLLFIYYGSAGIYAYVSEYLKEHPSLLDIGSPDDLDIEPEDLARRIDIDGASVYEVDCGWNGVNFYGFRPTPKE